MADRGPFLIVAALWANDDDADVVAHAVSRDLFPSPRGFDRGQVVSFAYEVADSPAFRRTLERLNLAELNERPNDGR